VRILDRSGRTSPLVTLPAMALLAIVTGTSCGGPPTSTDVKLGTPESGVAVGSHFRVKVPVGVGGHCVPVPVGPSGGSCISADRGTREIESVDIEPSSRFELVEKHHPDDRIAWLELKALESGEATLTVEARGTIDGDTDRDTTSTTLSAKAPQSIDARILEPCRADSEPPSVPTTNSFTAEVALLADGEQLEVSPHWFEQDPPEPLVFPDEAAVSIADRSFDPPLPADSHSITPSHIVYRIEPEASSPQEQLEPVTATSDLDPEFSQTVAFESPGIIDTVKVAPPPGDREIQTCPDRDFVCSRPFHPTMKSDDEPLRCEFAFEVTTRTPEVCKIGNRRPREGPDYELYETYRYAPDGDRPFEFDVAALQPGTCEAEVSVPEAADGEVMSQQLELPVTERK